MIKKWGLMGISVSLFLSAMVMTQAKPLELFYDGKAHAYHLPAITLYVNEEKVKTQIMDPVQIDDRVLVPVREVFEPMGAGVEWNAKDSIVYITYKDSLLILQVNQKTAWLNNEALTLDVPGKIINEKLMVPVRFISEAMGFDVKWEQATQSVYINEQSKIEEPIVIPTPPIETTQPTTLPNTYIGNMNIHTSYIASQNDDKANIISTEVIQEYGQTVALINGNAPISSAKIDVQAGKVIVDIANSSNQLSSSSIPTENAYIKGIRTSQFTTDSTRVVFDLKSGAITEAVLSEDRKTIKIRFSPQNAEEIKTGYSATKGDFIYLKGLYAPQITVETGQASQTLLFKADNIAITERLDWTGLAGEHMERVTIASNGTGILGTIYTNKDVSYTVESDDQGSYIYISKPTYDHITYESGSRPKIVIDHTGELISSQIKVEDLYREKKLIVDLGRDYSGQIGYGTMSIGDGKVGQVEIVTNGTTKLIINTQTVYTLNINDMGSTIEIELLKPKEKYNQVIVLDAGHGGKDNGASGNGLKEKEVNLKQTLAVYRLLQENPNIKVYMTREVDEYPTLQYRTELANDIAADLFVSIHNNSATSTIRGTETLYYPNEAYPQGKQFAQIVQNKLIAATQMTNRGIKARPDLYVLRTSNMPAVLIEGGFLSNAQDAGMINSSAYINQYANAVYESILEMFTLIS